LHCLVHLPLLCVIDCSGTLPQAIADRYGR
jgi:hypothetical protein